MVRVLALCQQYGMKAQNLGTHTLTQSDPLVIWGLEKGHPPVMIYQTPTVPRALSVRLPSMSANSLSSPPFFLIFSPPFFQEWMNRFIYLLIRGERAFLSAGSCPRCLQWPELGQAEASKIQELDSDLPCRCQGSMSLCCRVSFR